MCERMQSPAFRNAALKILDEPLSVDLSHYFRTDKGVSPVAPTDHKMVAVGVTFDGY